MGKKNNDVNQKLKGIEGFEKYYSTLFSDRWENLKEALKKDNIHAEWKVSDCESYFLDPASVYAALLLPVKDGNRFLDMCAAPGGKTLVIASRMPEDATLISNERSANRKMRLLSVCDSCLPEEIRNRVKITLSDGAKWCLSQTECFDRILLDAPCSSERHVLNDEKYLKDWSESRIKTLSMEQWALLSSAYRLLEKGGFLLYSTCALNKLENDEIIRKLKKKFPDARLVFENQKPELSLDYKNFCKSEINLTPERTEFGFHLLPDLQNGSGPIWFTLIQKP